MEKTMGSSLAHGLSRRQIRESSEEFSRKLSFAVSTIKPGKTSRAATYRAMRKQLTTAFKESILVSVSDGAQDGKNRNARLLLCTWLPYSGKEKENAGILVTMLELYARNLDLRHTLIADFTHHCIARVLQTYRTANFIEFFQAEKKIIRYVTLLYKAFLEGIYKPGSYAFILSKGVLIFVWDEECELFTFKTAISFESISPSKYSYIQSQTNQGNFFIEW